MKHLFLLLILSSCGEPYKGDPNYMEWQLRQDSIQSIMEADTIPPDTIYLD